MKYKIAENIKRLRAERSLTQNELAKLLCVTPQAVSRWESAQSSPDIEMIGTIAQFFAISYDELLGGQDALCKQYKQRYFEANQKAFSEPSERNTMDMLDALEPLAKYDTHYLGKYFNNLMAANRKYGSVPDTRIAEARNMLKKKMAQSTLSEKLSLLSTVAYAEDEENFPFWEDEYEDSRIDLWDEELVSRYSRRGDESVFVVQRAKAVYQKIMRLINQITAHADYSAEDVKMILDTLNVYSTKADDIFILERLLYKFRYARMLYAQKQDEKVSELLEELKDGLKILIDMPSDAMLCGSVPLLSPLAISYSRLKHHHKLFEDLLIYMDDLSFKRLRNDERFRELQNFIDELLTPKRPYKYEERPEWRTLLKKAEELCAPLGNDGSVIVLEAESGNIYSIVFQDLNAAIDADGALKLFAEMKENCDLVVKRLVCLIGGYIDIPSYSFREKLVEVERRNLSALRLANGYGNTLIEQELRLMMPAYAVKERESETQTAENNRSKKKTKRVTEIVFAEITRNVLKSARKLTSEKGDEKISENILCFGTMFNIGNIDCDLYGDDRIESLNTLLRDGIIRDRAIQYRAEAEKIVSLARAGETLRVWYSNTAFSLCGLYCLCDMLSGIDCDIRVVECPKDSSDRFEQGSWEMMSPKRILPFAAKSPRELSDEDKHRYSTNWYILKYENAAMRLYNGEKMLSVPEDKFDGEFMEILEKKNFNRMQAIGEFVSSFPVNVELSFFINRIDYLIKNRNK